MPKYDYDQIKVKFIVGLICLVLGIAFAVGGHIHAQELDIGRLLYYEVSDLRVYAFVGCALLGFILMGIPFIRLRFVTNLFMLAFYLISHNTNILKQVKKSGADTFYFQNADGTWNFNEEKSRFRVIVECVLGILALIVGGLILYAVGVASSIFVVIGQLIYLIANKKKK